MNEDPLENYDVRIATECDDDSEVVVERDGFREAEHRTRFDV